MTDKINTSALERVWSVDGLGEILSFNAYDNGGTEYIRANLYGSMRERAEKAEAERDAANARAARMLVALRMALPLMKEDDWGVDYGEGTERREALYAAISAMRREEEEKR